MLCYLKFHFKQQLCGEEHQYTVGPFHFFLKKTQAKKMTLLLFLVLSRYGLACKYGVISKYQYIVGWRTTFSLKLLIFKIKLQFISYLNLLQQIGWFVT